jgi:Tol biopolymer transport system component
VFGLRVDERSAEAPIYRSDAMFKVPRSWSPDGRWLVLSQVDPESGQNVWRVGATGADARVLVESSANEQGGPVSPDGRWLAFFSEHTGRGELYVQPFGEAGRQVQVSKQGALEAWWTPDGNAILFLDVDNRTLWRVGVTAGATNQVTDPVKIGTFPSGIVSLDAAPDRKRFLVITPERLGPGSITIVQNWLALPGARGGQ